MVFLGANSYFPAHEGSGFPLQNKSARHTWSLRAPHKTMYLGQIVTKADTYKGLPTAT
ncbi:hypothetical protein BOTBODRAFT_33175 [Botryobasidium botryosum FD-172 SS1]|uniref:Uncharacterized protein n=1 Tax=Botryobasidium botryosum (strain FD-172 SS1) TaxID=930990 RepID=A0A067MR44_BOTB1|nr:hypothetical protein BOTBODRAFT_33175 [Botryobasidium botryosum FD-172 SS1]